jgi:hypothetical protein
MAFGIRIVPFDLHWPNAGIACDETSEEPFPSGSMIDTIIMIRCRKQLDRFRSALTARPVGCSGTRKIFESQSSGVLTSDFRGIDGRRCHYRSFSKSFKSAVSRRGALQDTGGYMLANFVGRQLLREPFTRPVESNFHIGDSSFVKVIGNHFNVLRQLILHDFCLETAGLSVR